MTIFNRFAAVVFGALDMLLRVLQRVRRKLRVEPPIRALGLAVTMQIDDWVR